MKFEDMKKKQGYIPRALLLLSGLLALLIGAKVYAFVATSKQIPVDLEKILKAPSRNKEKIEKHQSFYTDAVGELKKQNFFMPPKPAKKNPVTNVTAILGDEVCISNKWYKVGDKIQDAKVTSISSNEVTIMWNEKETKLQPFDSVTFEPPPKTPIRKNKKKKDKSEKKQKNIQPEVVEQRQEMRRAGLSDEERRKRMQEYIKNMTPEQKQQFMERRRSRGSGGRSRGPRGSGRPGRGRMGR
jgi:hypothetical protein